MAVVEQSSTRRRGRQTQRSCLLDTGTDLLVYERRARAQGYCLVAGIDEAGRGPLAGPVVAAAVILTPDAQLQGLIDSKLLSPRQREQWYDRIISHALAWSVAQVTEEEVDTLNILEATRKAMKKAVELLPRRPDYLLIDGVWPLHTNIPQQCIKKGDRRSLSIAAASVLAKVTRDRIMDEYHRVYPHYNFTKNKGYGSQEHLRALYLYGSCPIHRKSFRPVREANDPQKNTPTLPFTK